MGTYTSVTDRERQRIPAWRPILTGDLAERAIGTVQCIIDALRSYSPVGSPPPNGPLPLDASLATGDAGLAVLYGHLEETLQTPDAAELATAHLERAIDQVAYSPMNPGLHGGFAGVAWAVTHLEGRFSVDDVDDQCTDIDTLLLKYLAKPTWSGDYDLIDGLVGLGEYSLKRLPRHQAEELLTRVIDRLESQAEHTSAGVTWFTPPERLMEPHRTMCPKGVYNLGVAHGVPGVIALLGRSCAAGIAETKARVLLKEAVTWLLAQRLPSGPSVFPAWIGPGMVPSGSRLAWCYGDAGVSTALLSAARYAGYREWESQALAIAREAAVRPFEQSGVVDCGLCHGAAGVAHLFNRMFQATGDPLLRQAAQTWFDRCLGLRVPGRGLAGYLSYWPDKDGRLGGQPDPGLLMGVAGIALALVSATTSFEPTWDEVMMMAVPRPPITWRNFEESPHSVQ